jgi:general secretion pathway protein H
MTTDSATVMAQEKPAAIEDQTGVLHGAGGDTPPERPEQPAELLSATLADMFPAMPHPKPRLRAGDVESWARASDTADAGAPAPTEAVAMIEDGAWVQAGLLEAAVSKWEPTTEPTPLSALDTPEIPDIVSTATLPPASGIAAPDESDATEGSAGLLERGDRWGLNEAAARLADGLRVTREEALFQRQERVFTVDVEERAFAANSTAEPLPLDPALSIQLFTAKSELVGESRGGIRFFPDGSSTGGRIELELLGDRAAINVQWSNGVVTVER